jgi:hypothetical protein
MVAIVEAVYGTLAKRLDTDHEGFEDFLMVCTEVAAGHFQTAAEAVVTMRRGRDPVVMAYDMVTFAASCGCSAVEVMEQAIAAGKAAI